MPGTEEGAVTDIAPEPIFANREEELRWLRGAVREWKKAATHGVVSADALWRDYQKRYDELKSGATSEQIKMFEDAD